MKHNHTNGAQTAATANQAHDFATLLRAYETAHASGQDTATPLYALATACALSVLKKCIDPQRKAATDRQTVSNNGMNAALAEVRRGIMHDIDLLEKLTAAHNAAFALAYNDDGDLVQVVIDKDAEEAAAALQGETLSEGIDLVHTAAAAILEQTADHAADPGWLESPYTMRKLSRRVLIRADDAAAWEEEETSPIREVYRAVRRAVQNSRAMQTDPRNGYCYLEETAADPDSTATETVYRRLHKWSDLGGYTMTGHHDEHGSARRGGLYTADAQTAADHAAVVAALNLTDRQAQVVRLRMSGYGYQAIATYLGIRESNVRTILSRLQEKCSKAGFAPEK